MDRLCVAALMLVLGILLSEADFLGHNIGAAVLLVSVPFLIAKGTITEANVKGSCLCGERHDR
jgi:hypothetical protein